MRIKITADSTCDLSPKMIERYDITIIPLYVVKGGQDYRDGVDITPKDIFEYVDNGGELCSTSAVSVVDFQNAFANLSKEYDAVIHIDIGSGFSACYQNACIAAEDYDNIYVVDSQNLSSGEGHVVVEAAKMAQSGADVQAILKHLEEIIPKVEASFLIERLDYMAKGGRCSSVAAFGANILGLKPCIEVKNGKMEVVKKYRGAFDKCILEYVKDRIKGRTQDLRDDLIFITHPACEKSTVKMAEGELKSYSFFKEIEETNAGCTVSCHCGPHTLGVLFIRK